MDYRMYKLSRIGTLFDIGMLFRIIGGYGIVAIIYGIYAWVEQLSGAVAFYMFLGAFFIVHLVFQIHDKPTDFITEKGRIIFIDRVKNIKQDSRGRRSISLSMPTRPLMIRVNTVESIEYFSNPIESAFGIGHIRIRGAIKVRNPDGSSCDETFKGEYVDIYGIKNFNQVCRDLKNTFIFAIHTGTKY